MTIRWCHMIGPLLLAGCGSQSSKSDYVDARAENSDQAAAPQSDSAQPKVGNEQSKKTAEKPTIDLEVVSIDLPGTIKRDADFPITVTVRNNSNTELGFAELDVRAVIKNPLEAMDLALGSGTARDIEAHESKTVTFTARAPHVVAAPAEISVEAKPGLATDPNQDNNLQRRDAFVVN